MEINMHLMVFVWAFLVWSIMEPSFFKNVSFYFWQLYAHVSLKNKYFRGPFSDIKWVVAKLCG